MASLIRQEQKKRGLIPYDWKCNNCEVGFDEPKISTMAPHLSLCPKCEKANIEENKNKGVNDEIDIS